MNTKMTYFLFAFLGIIVFLQFIPVDRTNPPVVADLNTAHEIKIILKESCYDCHSNQTKWPWYSYIAPVSWLITNDVNDGRRHLNFSEWENLNKGDQIKLLSEIWEEVGEGEMPLSVYTLMHSHAKLTDEQIEKIGTWTKTQTDSTKQ